MTTTAATKIVIVSGQEFSVPADTDNEAIREHLKANGFPDVAAAQVQTGKRTVDGVEVQTIEFIKKAGTKGLSGAELAELLSTVPAERMEDTTHGLSKSGAALLQQMLDGELTVGAALADVEAVFGALLACESRSVIVNTEGVVLCGRVDRAHAVPCAIPSGW